MAPSRDSLPHSRVPANTTGLCGPGRNPARSDPIPHVGRVAGVEPRSTPKVSVPNTFRSLPVLLLLGAATPVFAQGRGTSGPGVVAPLPAAVATRAVQSPIVDGRDTDDVWRDAPAIDQFRQFAPAEDGDPSFRTVVRVAYDDRNLYVLVRAFDPQPDSLLAILSRRDVKTPSDQIKIIIDAYNDRRTGVEMAVNPAGVKRDASIYQDYIEDLSWDGIWDVATHVDSSGWIAEFRVPFSQLRFAPKAEHTFGFGVWRDIARLNERVAWPVYSPSRQALASQLGLLQGIGAVQRSSRLELLPYVVSRNVTEPRATGWAHPQQTSAGLDVKYGLTQNLTLDATFNPDFGQVEADPAVLNLTAFEIRFDERRPFFQEGVGLFKCQPCQGSFYTRRIGRAPQLRTSDRDPTATTILAAAKLTGRLATGLSIGLVDALTQREVGEQGTTIEPQTNYLVGRLQQAFRGGRSSLGLEATAVNRSLDRWSEPYLRRAAYVGFLEGFHRFAGDRYELAGWGGGSHVSGSRNAIALTQLSPVHLYQRPDDRVEFDSTRTTLGGSFFTLALAKVAGRLQFSTYLRRASVGEEINDLGLVPAVNEQSIRNSISLRSLRPGSFYRKTSGQIDTENHWTTEGLPSGTSVQLRTGVELLNSWNVSATYRLQNIGTAYCVPCARGGPALRQSPRNRLELQVEGDPRHALIPVLEGFVERGDRGETSARGGSVSLDQRSNSRFAMTVGVNAEKRIEDQQWVGNHGSVLSDTTHFTFARLDQSTFGITVRGNWTASPTLSVQVYAQPFVSTGAYSNWREIANARSANVADRFSSYGGGLDPDGFNFKQFNSNAVVRWEYRAGSTLFVVWQQGRSQTELNPGDFAFARDYRDLFRAHPINTVLVKLAHWFNP
ncbi:MAG: hypothetical protein MNPFHGCM_00454 [Gemmatimonadaceae bacterium]|nr:hypothetical protein [Gemmatimonadaceae bacterium]